MEMQGSRNSHASLTTTRWCTYEMTVNKPSYRYQRPDSQVMRKCVRINTAGRVSEGEGDYIEKVRSGAGWSSEA
eukprot:6202675-Pleurochrysis_carterae.AAC.4